MAYIKLYANTIYKELGDGCNRWKGHLSEFEVMSVCNANKKGQLIDFVIIETLWEYVIATDGAR